MSLPRVSRSTSESGVRPMEAIPESIAFTDRSSTYADPVSSRSPGVPPSASSQATTGTFGSRASRMSSQRSQETAVIDGVNLQALNLNEFDENTPLNKGWPALAQAMARVPVIESFRRFRELNIKNLLYYQAELAEMEEELRRIENEDSRKTQSIEQNYSRHAAIMLYRMPSLEEATRTGNPRNILDEERQCKLVLDIRQKLEKYSKIEYPPSDPIPLTVGTWGLTALPTDEALLRYAEVSKLANPEPRGVEVLKEWIIRRGVGVERITGEGAEAWGSLGGGGEEPPISPWKRILAVLGRLLWPRKSVLPKELDLVATTPPLDLGTLTRWMALDAMPLFDMLRSGYPPDISDISKIADRNHVRPLYRGLT